MGRGECLGGLLRWTAWVNIVWRTSVPLLASKRVSSTSSRTSDPLSIKKAFVPLDFPANSESNVRLPMRNSDFDGNNALNVRAAKARV